MCVWGGGGGGLAGRGGGGGKAQVGGRGRCSPLAPPPPPPIHAHPSPTPPWQVGVAKDADVVAVRILDCTGSGTISDTVAGLDWVAANHRSPAVVTLSLGIQVGGWVGVGVGGWVGG